MKTVGLIGGMSWESTLTYYKIINEMVKKKLGGLHSGQIILYSVDFEEIEKYQRNDEWDKSAQRLSEIALKLQMAGADFIVICTNTMHKVADRIAEKISIPIVHIAEAMAELLLDNNIKKVALLGTKYTMTEDFYKDKLLARGIDILVPSMVDIDIVNEIIYNELCLGIISEKSRKEYQRIIMELENLGAQGVILGCTEIGLLIKPEHSPIPVFDTTKIHADKAVLMLLDEVVH
ncbi:MAG: aspartate racemase [Candidatus Epulonipiscioides saccharophilum]|nr:MAG: aspartate racemase [Epulopiscium sp. AS2M-Bin001]